VATEFVLGQCPPLEGFLIPPIMRVESHYLGIHKYIFLSRNVKQNIIHESLEAYHTTTRIIIGFLDIRSRYRVYSKKRINLNESYPL